MRRNRDYAMFLEDIVECADKIDEYIKNLAEEDFLYDEKTKDATIVRIQIIGEAIKNIPAEWKRKYKNINWKRSVKLRNIFVHNYFGINAKKLWKTAKMEVPELKENIVKILDDLRIKKLI